MCRLARTQQCAKLRACSCRLQSGILTAVKLAKVGTAEAHMLQREAKLYQHCQQLQYQMLPGVLAAGPAMAGAAYLLATYLLPVVGFSDCSSAKYQAVHAVKALHGRRGLHGDIREKQHLVYIRCKTNLQAYTHRFKSIKALHTRSGLTASLRAVADSAAVYLGLSKLNRGTLGM